jgi:hypothetical protein
VPTLSPSKITGTAVVTADSRLSDTRTPTDNTVTDAKIATAGLAQSSLNGVAITAWAASTSYTKGALVEYVGVAYRRISAGTSRSSFDATEQTLWHQITPTPTSNGTANSLIVTDSSGSLNFYTMTGINYNFSSTGNGTTALTHGSGSANNSLELPLTNGVLVSTGDTNSVSNTMLAGSIAQSKIVAPAATGFWSSGGTYAVGDVVLYDYKTWRCIQGHSSRTTIPNNDTSYWQLQWKDQLFDHILPTPYAGTAGTGSLDPFPRTSIPGTRTLSHNNLFVTWFVATQNITLASITTYCNVAYSGGGTPVFQCGIFQPSDSSGNRQYIQTTVPQAKCLGRATIPNSSLSSLGSFTQALDSSVSLTAGLVYGMGFSGYASSGSFTTGAALPSIGAAIVAGSLGPYFTTNTGSFGTATLTVGTTYSQTGGVTNGPWARLNA